MSTKTIEPIGVESRIEALLASAGARDRVNIEKHLVACDAEPDPRHAQLVRRLLAMLFRLAPLPVKTSGANVIQFFVADGKYRMQVFAIEDTFEGSIVIYLPDVLPDAVSKKVLGKNGENYFPPGLPDATLAIEQMDVNKPSNPPEYIKHMTGWNRKAVRFSLDASNPQSVVVTTAERLCALAASKWVGA